jgi:hypothetical protein
MADFTEDATSPTTVWNEATRDPKKRYGVGFYGIGRYGQDYETGSAPDFSEVA